MNISQLALTVSLLTVSFRSHEFGLKGWLLRRARARIESSKSKKKKELELTQRVGHAAPGEKRITRRPFSRFQLHLLQCFGHNLVANQRVHSFVRSFVFTKALPVLSVEQVS